MLIFIINKNIFNLNMIEIKNTQLTLIGALTSKPYAFKARSWELKNIETIDLFDSICSNIRVDIRGSDIMRILPVTNEVLNEEWISDKTRFAYDGLSRGRFLNPMVKKNDLFVQSSWKAIFELIESKLSSTKFDNFVVQTGNFNDLEQLTVLDDLISKSNNVIINNDKINSDLQTFYTINSNLFKSKGQKIFILIGTNLRLENPILNIKLKKLSQKNSVLVAYIGPKYNYNINLIHLGTNLNVLNLILKGKHEFNTLIQNFLKKNSKNVRIKNIFKNNISLIFGNEFNALINHNEIITAINSLKLKAINFDINVIYPYSGQINASELGLNSLIKGQTNSNSTNLHYLLGCESTSTINKNDFVIFQGTHNEKIRTDFDIILPTTTWLEKSSLYMNCFGMIQKSQIVTGIPKNVKLDWKIIKMMALWFEYSNSNLFNKQHKSQTKLSNIDEIHSRLNELSPNIMSSISNYKLNENQQLTLQANYSKNISLNPVNIKAFIPNYYKQTSIEKNSKIMNSCTQLINSKKNNFSKN